MKTCKTRKTFLPHICPAGQLRGFLADDTGAVTVDWVVLSAAVVGLGIGAVGAVQMGASGVGDQIETSLSAAQLGGNGGSTWAPGQWDQHNPGIYDSYVAWMEGFSDENLLAHMANMEQYAHAPPGSGHPIDTYHDEYWIARDIAIERGLIDP